MKLAFIGAGNMAQAMIGGVLRKGLLPKNEIIATAATQKTIDTVAAQYGVNVTLDNKEAAKADIIVLAVKPVYYAEVIAEIKDVVSSEQIIVTIAAGKSVAWVEEAFGGSHKIVRTMPNTPALLGEGMTGMAYEESNYSEEEKAVLRGIFEACGRLEVVDERMMDAVGCVSGCSPAYVFMFIEAMADAAVSQGMPRKQAYKFASQTVLGSAKMVLETGRHPGDLKDMVCSPAGTTIEGVRILEQNGFRSAVFEALNGAAEKGKKM